MVIDLKDTGQMFVELQKIMVDNPKEVSLHFYFTILHLTFLKITKTQQEIVKNQLKLFLVSHRD